MNTYLMETVGVQGMVIHYYLLEDLLEERLCEYGVGIELAGEWELVRRITAKRREVEALLKSLICGQVTPTTVRDVVEDWLLQ